MTSLSVDGTRSRPLSRRILDAVARASQSDPLEFETPLYDSIDADALDALFRNDGIDLTVEFTYLGYHITVERDGAISVDEQRS